MGDNPPSLVLLNCLSFVPAAFRLRAFASIKASNTIQGAEVASAWLQTIEG